MPSMLGSSSRITLGFDTEQANKQGADGQHQCCSHIPTPRHPAFCRLLQIVFSTPLGARPKTPQVNAMHRVEEKHLCLQVKSEKTTGGFADHPKHAQTATEHLWSQPTSTAFWVFFPTPPNKNPSSRDWFLWKLAHQQTAHPTFW